MYVPVVPNRFQVQEDRDHDFSPSRVSSLILQQVFRRTQDAHLEKGTFAQTLNGCNEMRFVTIGKGIPGIGNNGLELKCVQCIHRVPE